MSVTTLADFWERDLRRLIDEVNQFQDEANLWRTEGSIKNTAGNLVLHIIGGTNYLIGTQLARTGYVRNRAEEFTKKGVERKKLVADLEKLVVLVSNTLNSLSDADLDAAYPIPFDDAMRTNSYVLVQLLAHLNYHLGQVNYLRRVLE